MNKHSLQLRPVTASEVLPIMEWFSGHHEFSQWSGPRFRFPVSPSTFIEDIKLSTLPSFGLLDKENSLIGFGQFYARLGKCHLGRLVIHPDHRGKGYIRALIQMLTLQGQKQLGLHSTSLFVLDNNHSAIIAYKKCGFCVANYPEPLPISNCLYMIRDGDQPPLTDE